MLEITRATKRPKWTYVLKCGTRICYDYASELGEAAAEFNFENPYDPASKDWDAFETGKAYALKAAKRQGEVE